MKQKWLILLYQVLGWMFIILMPVFTTYVFTDNWDTSVGMFWSMLLLFKSYIAVYFTNFYAFIPLLLYKRRLLWFILANIVLILVVNIEIVIGIHYGFEFMKSFNWGEHTNAAYIGYGSGVFSLFILNILSILAAVGIRNMIQNARIQRKLAEETAKRHEAELSMLKNQLNPHFLFNTLNNISSLVEISPEKCQDSIAQLADLLRYNLYESDSQMVPLSGEIDYMRNYIALMSLRYGSASNIEVNMPEPTKPIKIAPMMFISLIENAFKHGMSTSSPSFVCISLSVDDDKLKFVSENSLHPKPEIDRAGSGIGLANIERRLNLLYLGRYTYTVNETDNVYRAEITIEL